MPDWLMMLAGQLLVAGAIYGGIRSDVRALHEGVKEAKANGNKAHERIDSLLTKRA